MLRMYYIKMFLALMALLSLNVNGLRDRPIDKMNSVFTTIKYKQANIIFLQETFCDNDFYRKI